MIRASRAIVVALAAAAFSGAGVAGCGGGSHGAATGAASVGGAPAPASSAADGVVAQVGTTPITKPEVSHWMATLAGGDYYELSRKATVPAGLVSEPADYPACVASLEAAAASAPVKTGPPLTGAQLLRKCEQLYSALRTQAVEFLVTLEWVTGVFGTGGVTVSEAEARTHLKESRAKQGLVSEGAFNEYLDKQRRTVSDELAVMRLDVLYEKAKAVAAHDPGLLSTLTAAQQTWTAKTSCNAGYVVAHCKQFTGAPAVPPGSPSPAVLMEQVTAIATGRCTNRAACGHQ